MNVDLLRSYDELFKTKGWKYLLAEAEDELAMLKEQLFHNAKTMEEISAIRGQAFQLDKMLTLEATMISMVQQESEEADANL